MIEAARNHWDAVRASDGLCFKRRLQEKVRVHRWFAHVTDPTDVHGERTGLGAGDGRYR